MTMRALLLVLLALPAMAQRPDRLSPARTDRRDRLYAADASAFRLLSPSYAIPGGECSGQAITGSRGETVTFTRSSNATCTKSDGTLVTLSSNQPRVSLVGGVPMLLVEGSATNSFLNSGTPATQTITHATGTFTLWMDGTGSIAAAVGTATATGLPCTASNGTACTFTVSVGGTVVYTVSGSPTRAQVENKDHRTSFIVTAGTAVTRSGDIAAASKPSSVTDTAGCEAASFIPQSSTFASRIVFYAGGTGLIVGSATSVGQSDGSAVVSATVSSILGRRVEAIGRWSSNQQVLIDAASNSGTYDGSLVQPTVYFGSDSAGANSIDGYVGNIRLGSSTGACDR